MTFDRAGNLLVVDAGNHRVQKFDPSGTYMTQWGTYGTGPGQLNMPWGVAVRVDAAGRLYGAEHSRHRVQMYQRCE